PARPRLGGLPSEITISHKDAYAALLGGALVYDPDDFPPPPPSSRYTEHLDVTLSDEDTAIVFNNTGASSAQLLDETAEDQTPWLQGVTLRALQGLFGTIGTTNAYTVTVVATSHDAPSPLSCTNTVTVNVWFKNTPPDFNVKLQSPELVANEGLPVKPFTLDYLRDEDFDQLHTLTVYLVEESQEYGNINGTHEPVVIKTDGNETEIRSALNDVMQFNAFDGIMTSDTVVVYFVFEMHDGFDTTVKTNELTIVQKKTSPVITLGGWDSLPEITSDTTVPVIAFPGITVSDADEGGKQPVQIAFGDLTVEPEYLVFEIPPYAEGTLQSPVSLSALLREITFLPNLAAGSPLLSMPLGSRDTATISITATDRTGKQSEPRTVDVPVRRVNLAPIITVPASQPVLLNPSEPPLRPFKDIDLWNDDANDVTFVFEMDNIAKGTFDNVSGALPYGKGYQVTGSVSAILAIVTNVTFTLNAAYHFPPDDPGGTTFFLSAWDFEGKLTEETLAIRVQAPPRNWLVTTVVDDGAPGTFSHALNRYGNNDVITFALPEYPATLRLPDTSLLNVIATNALTIHGPGAELLTISGDTDGDGIPDRQFMVLRAPVTVEGVTIAACAADFGGAISVEERGHLIAREVIFRDCRAAYGGGAVDVFYGKLTVDACQFLDNATGGNADLGGGAVSMTTDQLVDFRNTVFAGNVQGGLNGAGGALCAEFDGVGFLDITLSHCTFVGNDDLCAYAMQATALFANGGCAFTLENNIFYDEAYYLIGNEPFEKRTLNVDASAEIWSYGGNICNNSTGVWLYNGVTGYHTLLNPSIDVIEFRTMAFAADGLTPTNIGAYAVATGVPTDITGRLRGAVTLPGAFDPGAGAFPAITEIQLNASSTGDPFIEIYAPFDAKAPVDLSGMTLYVNGKHVHSFGQGVLANPANATLFTADDPATMPEASLLAPGRGVVIVFPANATGPATFQMPPNPPVADDNVTPIVRASVVSTATEFEKLLSDAGNGSVEIRSPNSPEPIAPPYLPLPVVRRSFLTEYNDPASPTGTEDLGTGTASIATLPQAKGFAFVPHTWDSERTESPAAQGDGTPFGGDFPPPIARADIVSATEDDAILIDVLANDTDPAGEEITIVTFDAFSALGVPISFDGATGQLLYDPTGTDLHALPAGREVIDTFDYVIAVVSRDPSATSTATVTVTLNGLNDNPVGVDDLLVATLTEREAVRLMAHPDLSHSAVFPAYPETPVPGIGLLANDTDVDEGDTPDTFRITGVLSDADVHAITALAANGALTRVTAPGHGLASGATVTIVGVLNPARVNGAHAVTVIDDDTFDIAVTPGVFDFARALWVPTTTALTATTPQGVAVTLALRADPLEDSIIYDASASDALQTLAQGESDTNGFWYILVDRYNAPGIAYVSLAVDGVNHPPVTVDEPPALDDLVDRFGGD
ncbi:MAG: Ig-like domain-containing protein, partial [Kiritimatiellaeota bacterium]|nr:Ig-like domain-containing protein [Kiritimatiellota bacterium]